MLKKCAELKCMTVTDITTVSPWSFGVDLVLDQRHGLVHAQLFPKHLPSQGFPWAMFPNYQHLRIQNQQMKGFFQETLPEYTE